MALSVFYSYAHEDSSLRLLLEKHLATLRKSNLIADWHDRNINAGQEWAKEVNKKLDTADIILLLISPDFVSSEYCYSVEMKRALERHENNSCRVIPVILRPGDYEETPFCKLAALPTAGVPVRDRKWRTTDEAFKDVAQGIRKVVNELQGNQWLYQANIYLYRQDYQKSLDAYEAAICLAPDNPLAYIGRGNALLELGRRLNSFDQEKLSQKALESFEAGIKMDASLSEAYLGKGKALLAIIAFHPSVGKGFPDIIDAYNKASALDPENIDVYFARGKACEAYRRYEEALRFYTQYLELATIPQAGTHLAIANMLYKLGRYNEALDAYGRSFKEVPDAALGHKFKGDTLFKLKRFQEALNAYKRALSLGYQRGDIYIQQGRCLYELKYYQQALEAYDKSIQEKESLSEAYKEKSNILQTLAKEALEKVNEANDFDPFLDDDDELP